MSCESEQQFPIEKGWKTIAGYIAGIKITEISAAAITITSFMIVFILFLIIYPRIVRFDLKCQAYMMILFTKFVEKIPTFKLPIRKLLNCCLVNSFSFVVSIRPTMFAYLIFIGMLIGVFLRLTGLNCALKNELMSFNLELFTVIFIPPLFIKSTYMGTKEKIFFHNFFLLFFHHYVIIALHLFGAVFLCFFLAFILFYLSFGSLSFLECLLLSSIMSGCSPGSILGALNAIRANYRLVDILTTESQLTTPLALMFYGIFLYLIIATQNQVSSEMAWAVVGLAFLRFFYMIIVGITIGIGSGFIGCLFVKFTYPKNLRLFQPLCTYLFMFFSYFISSLLNSHGILGMVPCSMFMARYSHFAMSEKSRETTENLLSLFAATAGQLVYIYVGISFVESFYETHWDWKLILLANFFVVFIRFVYIFTVDSLWNIVFKIFRIKTHQVTLPKVDIFLTAASGLKGALPFIFAFILPPSPNYNRTLLRTTTIMVVIPSLFIQAPLIIALLKHLNLKKRRMSIREKVLLCLRMISKLEKVKVFIPNVRTPQNLKSVMVLKVNENFEKFKECVKSYYFNTKFEKERREKHHLWPKSQVDVGIMFKSFEMLQSVYLWSEEVSSSGKLIRIEPGIGIVDEDIIKAKNLIPKIDEQSEKIKIRLCGLMKLKQYGNNIIKFEEKNFVVKMKKYGHIPIGLEPTLLHMKNKDFESHYKNHACWKILSKIFRKLISYWDAVDLFIQRLINIDSISTQERIFLVTEYWYKKYHWVESAEELDENLEFLRDVIHIVPEGAPSTIDKEEQVTDELLNVEERKEEQITEEEKSNGNFSRTEVMVDTQLGDELGKEGDDVIMRNSD